MSENRLALTRQNADQKIKCPESFYTKFGRMGYQRAVIELAYESCVNPDNESQMLDKLLEYNQQLPMDIEPAPKSLPMGISVKIDYWFKNYKLMHSDLIEKILIILGW